MKSYPGHARRVAALDLGSLTVRLAVAEAVAAGNFRVLLHRREVTGLGQGLAATGELAPAGMARTLEALQGFKALMTAQGVERYRAVGTQALRQAANRQVFLDRVRQALGLAVEVLAPEEEARLSLAGVLSVVNPEILAAPAVLVFDVGGGSSEFALVRPGAEKVFASLPLGVLTLSQARPLSDPPIPEKVAALKDELAARLGLFYKEAIRPRLDADPRLVGTAGAVTTLAAMHLKLRPYDPDKINNLMLTRDQVAVLADQMARLPEAERARLVGMEPAKAGVMVAGALIVLTILEVCRQDSLVVIDAGLLEGVLQEMARKFSVSRFARKV
jgi:exopolyphosphatase/guanosine-5'-triphosphate,3'-diphosphate pyrophosphatase